MGKTILMVVGLVALAALLLCVRILLRKGGTFGAKDIGQSKAMRDRGIHCATTQDRLAQRANTRRIDVGRM